MMNITQSNSLADLAARIRVEHEATAAALQRGVMHAMAAGDLLIEAKAQLKHGQWLPWLRDHCQVSERMAQRYIRLARNRSLIEAKSDTVSDLGVQGALALLTVPSRNSPNSHLLDAAVESLCSVEEAEEALTSLVEGERRKPLLDHASADMDRLGELLGCQPQLEAEIANLLGEIETAATAYISATLADSHEAAFALASDIQALAAECVRQVGAAS